MITTLLPGLYCFIAFLIYFFHLFITSPIHDSPSKKRRVESKSPTKSANKDALKTPTKTSPSKRLANFFSLALLETIFVFKTHARTCVWARESHWEFGQQRRWVDHTGEHQQTPANFRRCNVCLSWFSPGNNVYSVCFAEQRLKMKSRKSLKKVKKGLPSSLWPRTQSISKTLIKDLFRLRESLFFDISFVDSSLFRCILLALSFVPQFVQF